MFAARGLGGAAGAHGARDGLRGGGGSCTTYAWHSWWRWWSRRACIAFVVAPVVKAREPRVIARKDNST